MINKENNVLLATNNAADAKQDQRADKVEERTGLVEHKVGDLLVNLDLLKRRVADLPDLSGLYAHLEKVKENNNKLEIAAGEQVDNLDPIV